MEIQDKGYPKLQDPKGRKIEHAVILKVITTNICGSDLHIYNGRFAAPKGMQMGHENTGEMVEVGSHVERIKVGDVCSVPFNVACGWVDAAVDCVGLECHGYGPDGSSKNVEEAVINTLMEVIKPAGAMGIGVYTNLDPAAPTELNKRGGMALGFPAAWVKSPTFTAGQCPVMHYNRDLMMAILWDRMPYLTPLLNTEVIPLERAVEAYQIFHDGSPKKFVIDPHNMTKLMSTGKAGERAKVHASAHHR
jgi:threonine dehydrogenase-like Zn-dependent dehydrogenase